MATETQVQAAEPTAKGRIRPHQIVLGIGIVAAVGTVMSWVLSNVIFDFHEDSHIHREVFGDIPDAWVVVFYTLVPILLLYGAWNFSLRVRNWERGAPDDRRTTPKNFGRRRESFLRGVYMQTLLRDPAAGLMHSLIYFGFLVLLAVTAGLQGDHQMPGGLKFLPGGRHPAYALTGDVAGLALLAGVLMAVSRRYVQRVYRIRIKSKPEHAVILFTFLALALTGF